jgi:hypothetical protein
VKTSDNEKGLASMCCPDDDRFILAYLSSFRAAITIKDYYFNTCKEIRDIFPMDTEVFADFRLDERGEHLTVLNY